MNKVDVIVHPQSIVHSMVEYMDGTVLAQMSSSDMCFPIQYAVTWPDRVPNSLKQLNFAEIGQLVFEAPRAGRLPRPGPGAQGRRMLRHDARRVQCRQ